MAQAKRQARPTFHEVVVTCCCAQSARRKYDGTTSRGTKRIKKNKYDWTIWEERAPVDSYETEFVLLTTKKTPEIKTKLWEKKQKKRKSLESVSEVVMVFLR